jgi:tetratricopeptide (TPR) repeat protein
MRVVILTGHCFQRACKHVLPLVSCVAFPLLMPTAYAYDLHDNAITHANAAQQLMDLHRPQEAIDELKAALALKPYVGMAAILYNNLGLAYRAIGNYVYAYACFQRACRIQPSFAMGFQNLVETYQMAGQLEEVEQYMKDLLAANLEDAEAWFILGTVYRTKKNPPAAKICFERFLKLQPESEMADAARKAL